VCSYLRILFICDTKLIKLERNKKKKKKEKQKERQKEKIIS
jgi:hypothetical protein